jgi:hypothetical protein
LESREFPFAAIHCGLRLPNWPSISNGLVEHLGRWDPWEHAFMGGDYCGLGQLANILTVLRVAALVKCFLNQGCCSAISLR